MPTSASRRVWEGKAKHYNLKKVKSSIALSRRPAGAGALTFQWRNAKKKRDSPCARRNTVQKYSLIP